MLTAETQTLSGLEIKGLDVKYGNTYALKDIDLSVRPGEVIALIGANGAGKSTLMKVIAGVIPHTEYSGEMYLGGAPAEYNSSHQAELAGVTLVPQELLTLPERSVLDNQFLGGEPTRGGLINAELAESLGTEALGKIGANVSLSQLMGNLSASEQQQVQISRAFLATPKIVLFDEPTSSLSLKESFELMRTLRALAESGTTVLLITHRIAEAMSVADRMVVLRNGLKIGEWDTNDVTPEQIVEHMLGRQLAEFEEKSAPVDRTALELKPRLVVRDLNVSSEYGQDLSDISFEAYPGEAIGVFGLMGAGRTELLEAIFGTGPKPLSGEIELDGIQLTAHSPGERIKRGIGLVTEDRRATGLALDLSLIDNTLMADLDQVSRFGVMSKVKERQITEGFVDEMKVRTVSLDQPVRNLSGGNQQKIVIAKWLTMNPKVLLLDEPGRGVDVGAKADIFKKINDLTSQGMTVLLASSEPSEILSMCSRSFVLYRGTISVELSGKDLTEQGLLAAATGIDIDSDAQDRFRRSE